MYPLFVEQMIRLTATDAHGGAMVLPLSIACNTGRQFLALRQLLARTSGQWRFAFFDREPHALFGEDVKTRNAIVLWTRQGCETEVQISTGPLRKWRGEDRARMLEGVTFTPIATDIRLGIPKVEGSAQAAALGCLVKEPHTLQRFVRHIGRATLGDAMHADASTVFVAATAYNFLSVFLRPEVSSVSSFESLTENPMLALSCPSREAALQLFAVLSSKLAYWWWHVHGDGFHVSRFVVETMPVGEVLRTAPMQAKLARLGKALWQEVLAAPVVSRNRGRTSLGFSAAASPLRQEIDALLIDALALTGDFAVELERFCARVTNAQLAPRIEQDNQRKQAHDLHAVG
jgi:hypothetical protein